MWSIHPFNTNPKFGNTFRDFVRVLKSQKNRHKNIHHIETVFADSIILWLTI